VGASIAGLRGLSVAFAVLGLALWGLFLRDRFSDRPLIVVAGLLVVAFNPYLLSWNATVKTYALTNLCVFATIWALNNGLRTRKIAWYTAAGAAAGLAVGVRLLYLPWALATFLAFVWLTRRSEVIRISAKSSAAAALGFLVVLIPSFRFLLADPARFRFNNYDYHNLRFSPLDSVPDPTGWHLPQIEAAFNVWSRAIFQNYYLLLIVVLAFAGWLLVRRHQEGEVSLMARVFGFGAITHMMVCLLPDPTHAQYFTSSLAPMLAVTVVCAIAGLEKMGARRGRGGPVTVGFLAFCLAISAYDLQVGKTGMDWAEVWSFEHQAAVKKNIMSRTEPGDVVLAFWSGYVFESDREFVFGMQNHFAIGVSERLDLVEMVDYKIAGKEIILRTILTKQPKVVVLGAWMHEMDTTLSQKDLPLILQELDANYEIDWMLGETKVMVRRPGPGLKM